jgi:autotransporter-associated beta strand protein
MKSLLSCRVPLPAFARTSGPRISLLATATALVLAGGSAIAASNSWVVGGNGNYNDPTKWTGGVNVPNGAGDVATSDGAGSIIALNTGDTVVLSALNLNLASGATTFNQSGGILTLGALGFGGGGASRNPTYNLSGGTLDMTNFTWGNGSAATFNVSAGTATLGGTTLSIGVANGSRGTIAMTGGIFNANNVTQLNLGNTNGGNGRGTIALSGDAQFNANAATVVVGQFGSATNGGANNSLGTLTISGTATLNAANVVIGGNNAGSWVNGVVNLNGGTIATGSIRRGSTLLASSSTQIVINANGGTIKATTHANNSNFLQGAFVNLDTGGLKFNTNGNAVGISNAMSGTGGFTKQGAGTLTLSGVNTYTGATTVEAGELHLAAGAEIAGATTVKAGATLSGFGTIKGSTTIEGIHAVGASPGLQTFTAGLAYVATGVLNWELSADTAGDRGLTTGFDAIDVTGGSVTVDSAATINLVLNGVGSTTDFTDAFWDSNQSWLVIDGTSGGSSTFTLGSIPILDANGLGSEDYGTFSTFADGNGDHHVLWTAVPEPSAALLGSLGILALLKRRTIRADA